MIVQIQQGDSVLTARVLQEPASALVVYTAEGHPVIAVYQLGGKVVLKAAGERGFAETLKNLGVSPSVIPEVVQRKLSVPGAG